MMELQHTARDVLGYYNYEGGYRPGGFTSSLINAFEHADLDNFSLLSASFPMLGHVLTLMHDYGEWAVQDLAYGSGSARS